MTIFRDLTQDELDRAYDQRVWAPDAEALIARHREASLAVRTRLPCRADLRYGPHPEERLDFFPAAGAGAPLVAFIHGGAWRNLSKEESCGAAETFVAAGASFAALGFAKIPAVRLPEMVAQVRRAIAWLYRNAASLGADPERLYLAGHSSGGHLAGCVLTTDWAKEHGLPAGILKGGLCMSGMYDLEPVMLSQRGAYLQLAPDEIAAFSSRRRLAHLASPVLVAHGGRESPEFQRQAQDFAAALGAAGRLAGHVVLPAANHFEVPFEFTRPDGILAGALLRMMRLAPHAG